MALAIDASTPDKTTVLGSGTSFATPSFSPPAGSVIFLLISGAGSAVVHTQSVTGVTDSLGSHLSWALFSGSQANHVNEDVIEGNTEVWWAACPSGATNMTATVTFAFSNSLSDSANPAGLVQAIVFTGASTTQNGQAAIYDSETAGTPSLSLTTSADNSWVISVVHNYTNSTGPTVPAGQTITIDGNSTLVQDTHSGELTSFWGQITTSATATASTSVTINDTAPTSIAYQMSIVEVLADNSESGDHGSSTVAWVVA